MFKNLFHVLTQKSLMLQALELSEDALGKAQQLTDAAFAALLDKQPPGFDLYEMDRQINRAEVEVRRMVFEHLALQSGAELTPCLILISVIIDIERIGDYAKNVYDQTERMPQPFAHGPHFDEVRQMVEEVRAMFGEVAESLRTGDAEVAVRVMADHHDIGKRCEAIIDEILDDEAIGVRNAVILALSLRFLKRISAHLSNLASSVVNPFDRIGFKPGSGSPRDADT